MKRYLLSLLLICSAGIFAPASLQAQNTGRDSAGEVGNDASRTKQKEIKKVLFIGDSMTGWLSERLNAYGKLNGFEVSTVVWDGSTIKKWASSPRTAEIIQEMDPDAVFVSLGMNELFESNPGRQLSEPVTEILNAIGNRKMVWLGPPSWPGQDRGAVLNNWLSSRVGEDKYFNSFKLELPRQSNKNPHPTRDGIIKWTDELIEWLKNNDSMPIVLDQAPSETQMSRGKVFIYKRINETL